ncbi:uncharacterized protein EI90DRAFT_3289621 [Cantharellus anzutake]|uniref:uncharacterized protein n=1 Tax=Cantharellus anzutake TaxID=1750568 RepID=UPI001906A004|nr:uncharacterized protein EI90DRAFT_3289621 [Cantharellus anzutake]KAF8330694.1 hypothetical protein EI90DRAFT_3289621 [Cantharellus anzutake]
MPATPILGDEHHLFTNCTVISLILSEYSPFLVIILDTQIPLSENLLNARTVMEAKLPKKIDRWDGDAANYEAQFNWHFSPYGRYVALGFGNGIIELIDIDQRTISRFQLDPPNYPAPLNFPMHVLSHGSTPVNLGINRPFPTYIDTLVQSDNGSFVGRVPRKLWFCSLASIASIAYILPLNPLLATARLGFLPTYRVGSKPGFDRRNDNSIGLAFVGAVLDDTSHDYVTSTFVVPTVRPTHPIGFEYIALGVAFYCDNIVLTALGISVAPNGTVYIIGTQ